MIFTKRVWTVSLGSRTPSRSHVIVILTADLVCTLQVRMTSEPITGLFGVRVTTGTSGGGVGSSQERSRSDQLSAEIGRIWGNVTSYLYTIKRVTAQALQDNG